MEFCYVLIFSCRNLFNPLFAAQAAQAPEGFYDVVGFEGYVDPEGWPVEDEAGQNAEWNCEYPEEDVVG